MRGNYHSKNKTTKRRNNNNNNGTNKLYDNSKTNKENKDDDTTTSTTIRTITTWVDKIRLLPIHEFAQQQQQHEVDEDCSNSNEECNSSDDRNNNDENNKNTNSMDSQTTNDFRSTTVDLNYDNNFMVDHDENKNDTLQSTSMKVDTNTNTNTIQPTTTTETSSVPLNEDNDKQTSSILSLSIISWNILANSYCSERSHRNLPNIYRQCTFNPLRRRKLIHNILKNKFSMYDIICLQEVDMTDICTMLTNDYGYKCIETPRSIKGNNGGRVDSCVICIKEHNTNSSSTNSNWKLVQHEIIYLDDIASLMSTTDTNTSTANDGSTTTTTNHNTTSNIQGIQQSFLRRNVAIVCRIQSITKDGHKQSIVIANAHLFWNPAYEYVKLCQAHYILQRIQKFMLYDTEPILFCGDFNSRPGYITHTYITTGSINAKRIAPWYNNATSPWYNNYTTTVNGNGEQDVNNDTKESSDTNSSKLAIQGNTSTMARTSDDNLESHNGNNSATYTKTDIRDNEDLSNKLDKLTLYKLKIKSTEESDRNVKSATTTPNPSTDTSCTSQPQMRYLLDATLNKFCRWLRILGIDTELESDAEEKLRTGDGQQMILFDRCLKENRTLVTTSVRLLQRRDCPSSVYCVNPQIVPKLEVSLMHMLLTHGVILQPTNFLSRCVMCNGIIVEVLDYNSKKSILAEYQAPTDLLDGNIAVFQCNKCSQGYWWCDRPTSSASRVKNTACDLFELCLRAGIPCSDDSTTTTTTTTTTTGGTAAASANDVDEMFQHLDREQLRKDGWDYSIPGSDMLRQQLDAIGWLKNENLQSPFGENTQLQSVYGTEMNNNDNSSTVVINERLPFTNVTSDFNGTLDYIFYDTRSLIPQELLYVPTSFDTLNTNNITNGHLLPSNIWPSDHLAVGARFLIQNNITTTITTISVTTSQNSTLESVVVGTNTDINTLCEEKNAIGNDGLQSTSSILQVNHIKDVKKSPSKRRLAVPNGAPNPFSSTSVYCGVLNDDTTSTSSSSNTDTTAAAAVPGDSGVIDSTISFPPLPIHSSRCDCGCVPMIPSLFEMAQMRKERRAAAAAAAAASSTSTGTATSDV